MIQSSVVDIKVGSLIREWVIGFTGSDIIRLDKTTNLWAIVKQNLSLLPMDYRPLEDRSEYISIELLVTRGTKLPVYNIPAGREIVLQEQYRCYITDAGQNAVRRYLENQLRNAFTVYMVGRFSNVGKVKIIGAITDFLLEYELPVEQKSINRLMKYWYRFREKNPEKMPLPIFF